MASRARAECRIDSLAVSTLISRPLFYCDAHSTVMVLKGGLCFSFFLFFFLGFIKGILFKESFTPESFESSFRSPEFLNLLSGRANILCIQCECFFLTRE